MKMFITHWKLNLILALHFVSALHASDLTKHEAAARYLTSQKDAPEDETSEIQLAPPRPSTAKKTIYQFIEQQPQSQMEKDLLRDGWTLQTRPSTIFDECCCDWIRYECTLSGCNARPYRPCNACPFLIIARTREHNNETGEKIEVKRMYEKRTPCCSLECLYACCQSCYHSDLCN